MEHMIGRVHRMSNGDMEVGSMKKYQVGVIGGTGMVGQRFVTLMENHPWFQLKVIAASARSAGKTYEEAVGTRWAMDTPMPRKQRRSGSWMPLPTLKK